MKIVSGVERKIVTLFEYQKFPYEQLSTFNLEGILESIDELNKASQATLLNLSHKYLSATRFVGMIQVGNVTFEILPKIDYQMENSETDTAYQSAANNLLVMLAYAYNINFDSKTLSSLQTTSGTWYELLIRFFALALHQEIERGLSQNYQIKEDVLPYIRGKWNIAQQIRKHALSKVDFALQYDEFTADILLNRVFVTCVNLLLTQTNDNTSRRLLLDIRHWLAEVHPLNNIDQEIFNQIHFSRLNERFKTAFQLAELFLSAQSLQVTVGEMDAYAFVFDMNTLFERFLTQFIIKYRNGIFPQPGKRPIIMSQFSTKETYLARDLQDRGKIQLKPDVVLKDSVSGIHQIILDMKYKQLVTKKTKIRLTSSDIYQMLAYSIRLNSENVILIYPQPGTGKAIKYRLNIPRGEKSTRIFVRTVNLHHPLENPTYLINELYRLFQPIIGGGSNAIP